MMSVGKEKQQDRKKGGWLVGLKVRRNSGRKKKDNKSKGEKNRKKTKKKKEGDKRKENRKQRNFKDKFPGVSLKATSRRHVFVARLHLKATNLTETEMPPPLRQHELFGFSGNVSATVAERKKKESHNVLY